MIHRKKDFAPFSKKKAVFSHKSIIFPKWFRLVTPLLGIKSEDSVHV